MKSNMQKASVEKFQSNFWIIFNPFGFVNQWNEFH